MLYDTWVLMINDLEDPFQPKPFYYSLGWDIFGGGKNFGAGRTCFYVYKNFGDALYNWILSLADSPSL